MLGGEVNRRDESIFRVNKLRMPGRFAECDWGQVEMRFEVIFERDLISLIEREISLAVPTRWTAKLILLNQTNQMP
jgi:hypothetical protein